MRHQAFGMSQSAFPQLMSSASCLVPHNCDRLFPFKRISRTFPSTAFDGEQIVNVHNAVLLGRTNVHQSHSDLISINAGLPGHNVGNISRGTKPIA
jgi:hypothetical protein